MQSTLERVLGGAKDALQEFQIGLRKDNLLGLEYDVTPVETSAED